MKRQNPKAKGGSNLLRLFIFIAVIGVSYPLLFEQSSPPPQDPVVSVPGPDLPSYATSLRDNWPPLADSASQKADPLQMGTQMSLANYYLVLDGSGSMLEKECADGRYKIAAAVDAVSAFASALPANSNFGLASFVNGQTQELSALGSNPQAGLARLRNLRPSGNTPLYSAVHFGYEKLSQQARRQSGYGEYHLVVVTDGMHSPGEDPTPILGQILSESPVVIHTIGFCISADHALNQPGRTYYRAATDPGSLKQGLDAVLAEAPDFQIDRFDN
ncbi:MAG: VWA domain-containing protein [Gammaproteobacteria bacterium]|nr:VWA domain-containing protein [Gammaproteobacteria bacterium]